MPDGDFDRIPELPTLGSGVYLLETDERATATLHSLVVDHLLIHAGDALWVDSHGHAQTQSLSRLAPSQRFLDRIQVARGFTAFQHQQLLADLAERVTTDTALVVVPALDYHYRADDLARNEPKQMVEAAVDRINRLAARSDVPVLLTCHREDGLTAPIIGRVDERIRVETTQFGPRFIADDFETLVYRENGYVQTTLAFWARVITERQQAREQVRQEVLA